MTAPRIRRIGRSSSETALPLTGAAVSAIALTCVLFNWITPMSGALGFVVVAFGLFLAMYAGLLSVTEGPMVVRDRVATVAIAAIACIGFGALLLVIVYTVVKGFGALAHWNFYAQDMTNAGPLDPLSVGGIRHALVGTAWTMGIGLSIAIPLGVLAALFLSECRGPVVWLVRTTVNAMTALPDIIAGLFIYIVWILLAHHQHSAFAASLALAIMMTPVIIRTSDVVLRMVAGNLREASEALGAPRWRTVWHVVLPTARSGLATAVILGAARGIGETAPVLLTSGSSSFTNANPFSGPNTSLPLVAFEFTRSPIPTMIARGFGAAAFLMLVVVVLFLIGRSLGGRTPGEQNRARIRRARRASARDSARFAENARRGPVQVPAIFEMTAAPTRGVRRPLILLATLVLALAAALAAALPTLAAVPISGAGSTWAQTAVDQWKRDVVNQGLQVNYSGTGSSDGRRQFLNGTTDFAVSDIPFQFHPEDNSEPETPASGTYAYMPVTAGGTVFMYNLTINGQRVTNLRLSGENVSKIFTAVITQWNDPLIAADNPGLSLPARRIVPVVRSDGSGSSAQFTLWMINQFPALWRAYCGKVGRQNACGFTSFFPSVTGMVSQSGDLGVSGYISQSYGEGAIGYVNYSYALNTGFPVAKILNKAGYYTEPTASNVAVSLSAATINPNKNDPAVYLTQDLTHVYNNPDPRTYELSSYSYFILPTKVQGQFTTDKGATLGQFAYYFMCQGQQKAEQLGYSPLPINLVNAGFEQIRKIPGVDGQSITAAQCNNPTFSGDGHNKLIDSAPMPDPRDKLGYAGGQNPGGSGGAKGTTPVKPVTVQTQSTRQTPQTQRQTEAQNPSQTLPQNQSSNQNQNQNPTTAGRRVTGSPAGRTGAASRSPGTSRSTAAAAPNSAGAAARPSGSRPVIAGPAAAVVCDPDSGVCGAAGDGGAQAPQNAADGSDVGVQAVSLAVPVTAPSGWGSAQTLMVLAGVCALLLFVAPPLVARRLRRTDRPDV